MLRKIIKISRLWLLWQIYLQPTPPNLKAPILLFNLSINYHHRHPLHLHPIPTIIIILTPIIPITPLLHLLHLLIPPHLPIHPPPHPTFLLPSPQQALKLCEKNFIFWHESEFMLFANDCIFND